MIFRYFTFSIFSCFDIFPKFCRKVSPQMNGRASLNFFHSTLDNARLDGDATKEKQKKKDLSNLFLNSSFTFGTFRFGEMAHVVGRIYSLGDQQVHLIF